MLRLQRFLIASALLVIGVMLGSYLNSGSVGADATDPLDNSSTKSTGDARTSIILSESLTTEEPIVEVQTVSPQIVDEDGNSESTNSMKDSESQQTTTTTDASLVQSSDSSTNEVNNNSNSETGTKTTKTESTDKNAAGVTKKSDVTDLKPVKIVQSNGSKVEIAPTEIKTKPQNTDKKKITSVAKYDSQVLPKTNETQTKVVLMLLGAGGLFTCVLLISICRKYS